MPAEAPSPVAAPALAAAAAAAARCAVPTLEEVEEELRAQKIADEQEAIRIRIREQQVSSTH